MSDQPQPPPALAEGGAAPAAVASVPVWNWAVRLSHWALAGSVLACLWLYEGGPWHERLGTIALVLALWRGGVALGLGGRAGTPHLRFGGPGGFVRGPAATWAYARALLARRAPRHLGHNPLGGWMIVALLGLAVLAGGTGALYATDRFWGDPTLYALHQIAGWSFAVLVPLHVVGVVVSSLLHRENLLVAMLTGRKRSPAAGDIGLR